MTAGQNQTAETLTTTGAATHRTPNPALAVKDPWLTAAVHCHALS